MKRVLILLFVLAELVSYGQPILKMSSVYSYTPAGANTPSSSVTYSTVVNLKVYVKNSGNVSYFGVTQIHAYRDTTNGVLCDTVAINQEISPNDSVPVILTFTPTPGVNGFKTGGNGNTIVVWPVYYSGFNIIGDSVKPILYVNDVNSVFEFEKLQFKLYPNPVLNELTIKSSNNDDYTKIIIYDVFARKVKEMSFKENIDVSDLTPGSYWMLISSEDKTYRVNFIKE